MSSEIYEIAKGVHNLLKKTGTYDRVINWLKRKTAYDVLLVGASGTGKSAFLKSLQGLLPYIRRDFRTDKTHPTHAKIGSSFFQFIDTPGETEHVDKRREAIRIAQLSRELGIINVVSYGYHEGLAPRAQAVKDGKASPAFLELRREVEENLTKEWTDILCGHGGAAKWLITVVTKADLWWEMGPDQKVLTHYRNGPYATLLKPEIGSLPHSVRSYSSHDQLFYEMVPMSGRYEEKQRVEDRDAFIARLLEFTSE